MTLFAPSANGAGTARSVRPPHPTLHAFFDAHWHQWPDAVAIEIPPGGRDDARVRCTYADLAALSHALTAAVANALPRPRRDGCLVALLLPRTSIHPYAAQLAVLRAGAAYVPIDPALPDDRIAAIVADAEPALLVTCGEGGARAARIGLRVDRVLELPQREDVPEVIAPAMPEASESIAADRLAYVIYTSGTTGRPKGVMVEHRAIANLVASDVRAFGLGPGDRVAQSSSHGYDSSLEETWLALASGATLVVLSDEVVRLGPDLVSWLDRERVTVVCPAPTLLRSMGLRPGTTALPWLTLVYAGGERMPDDLVDVWAPGRRMVNGYGPTECAVTAVRGDLHAGVPVTIGRAIPGVAAWVLDDALEPVPDGTLGELCLGGIGLARGYWRAPDLTARAFIDHPSFGRLYRTGDLARVGPDGALACAGRLDAQVKIRGHRIELEEIDAHLARCAGVSAAACGLSAEQARPTLVAAIVPLDVGCPPSPESLRAALSRTLPAHMVPTRFWITDALPTMSSGKLDRDAIGRASAHAQPKGRHAAVAVSAPDFSGEADGGVMQRAIAAHARAAFRANGPVAVDAHFFDDLGGDSLAAAEFVTLLRDDEETAMVTVRDVYAAPSVRALAARLAVASIGRPALAPPSSRRTAASPGQARPGLITLAQTAWLLAALVTASAVSAAVLLRVVLPLARRFGIVDSLLIGAGLAGPAMIAYGALTAAVAIAAKRRLIGRYTTRREPAWGDFCLRHWLVVRSVRAIPWWLIEGTELQVILLRALGARIGRRAHIHHGVDLLHGGWDLLTLGDDVTLNQEAALRLVDFEDGQMVIGPITLEDGVTIDVRGGVGPDVRMGSGSSLTPHSVLRAGARVPAGERWDGIPAQPSGRSPGPNPVSRSATDLSPFFFGFWLGIGRVVVVGLMAFPYAALAAVVASAARGGTVPALTWLAAPVWTWKVTALIVALSVAPLPAGLVLLAVAARALGTVSPGVIGARCGEYVRVMLKTQLVDAASAWLGGSLAWPVWLRAAGMAVGARAEISTIVDVVPELLSVGAGSFLTDGIYPGGPRVDRGAVTLAATRLGTEVFIGNHAVVPAGRELPSRVLVGVCTVMDSRHVREGSSWFGHPPFPLLRPCREGRRQAGAPPTRGQYATRVAWEALRFVLPVPLVVVGTLWMSVLVRGVHLASPLLLYGALAPVATLIAATVLCGLVLAIKWILLGRVTPGEHGFWSGWCGRWDFLYVAWEQLARPVLSTLEGTLLLPWYLRGMGAHVGRRAVLGQDFAQLVDPDMLWIGDDATITGTFQAHTFEDRVLKLDRIRVEKGATVGSGALVLYGAVVGPGSFVAPHSVVMKHERLAADREFEGCPIRQAK